MVAAVRKSRTLSTIVLIIDKPEAKSQSQSNPIRERGIWPLGLSLKSHGPPGIKMGFNIFAM